MTVNHLGAENLPHKVHEERDDQEPVPQDYGINA